MEYNLKLESDLKKLGFKKKFLDDKSGYWLEKSIKFLDLKGKIVIETDRNISLLDLQTYRYDSNKLFKSNLETVLKFKCDLKLIKEILKKYDK